MKIKEKRALRQIPVIFVLIIGIIFTLRGKSIKKTDYYDTQIAAYENMEKMAGAVRSYREEIGVPVFEYDIFSTGLLGDDYNKYTTSLGNLEAKRTSANPDMAAMVVKMFNEVGLKPGDNVAVAFSGSFPALNIAVLSAGEAMDLNFTIISSFGASTYGANIGELSFPKILDKLHKDGYTRYNSSLVTLGGDDDVASEKPEELMKPIISDYIDRGLNVYIEKDFDKNVKTKIDLYEKDGRPDCFIAVGGNITFLGLAEDDIANRQGILKHSSMRNRSFKSGDGLINYFFSENVPTIHLLNVKKIVLDYGLAFDPASLNEKGESNVFYTIEYGSAIPILCVLAAVIMLLIINKERFFQND